MAEALPLSTEVGFNSTMVRLKDRIPRQKGLGYLRFNSTMVRLKACARCCRMSCARCFNSTMVRLKASGPHTLQLSRLRFNSTMVRLKEKGEATAVTLILFQFHNGTIKSFYRPKRLQLYNVSIPQWYD